MAYKPNFASVPTANGNFQNVTVINAAIYARSFFLNWFDILCLDGVGNFVVLINAGLYPRVFTPGLVTGIHNPEVWGDFAFGPGYIGQPYDQQWYLSNLKHPVVFSIVAGALPPGLNLRTIGTTARGEVYGTPTEEGEFVFVLRALGPDVDAVKAFEIVITLIPIPPQGTAYVGGN